MIKVRSFIPFILSLFFISCKQPFTSEQKEFYLWIKKGEVAETFCKGNSFNKYSILVPENYELSKAYPLIICFDPHADGSLPLNLLKIYANTANCVITSSNRIKNGMSIDEMEYIFLEFLSDVKRKVKIDTSQIYLVGFSGGARVAGYVTRLVQKVQGIVACSAGYSLNTGPCINTISIAGNEDMNYLEVKQFNKLLDQKQCQHVLLTFNGKHQWPDSNLLSYAVDVLRIWKSGKSYFDTSTFSQKCFKNHMIEIENFKVANHWSDLLLQYYLLKQMRMAYANITDINILNEKIYMLESTKELTDALNNEMKLEEIETQTQLEIHQAFTAQANITWWKNKISGLQKLAANTSANPDYLMARRLLGYVSLLSYSLSNQALNSRNWENTKKLLTIYEMADPQNPDLHYFKACYYANTGENFFAIQSLKKSVELGLNHPEKMMVDPLLAPIQKLIQFDSLLKN